MYDLRCIPDGRPAGLGGDCEVLICMKSFESFCLSYLLSRLYSAAPKAAVSCGHMRLRMVTE